MRDAVVALRSERLDEVDSTSLLTDLTALRGLIDQAECEWLRRVGEVHARGAADTVGAGSTTAFLRGTVLLSPSEAGRAVRTASALRSSCAATATAKALADGVIGLGQAHVVTAVLDRLPSALPDAVRRNGELSLLEPAAALNPADLGRAGRHFASRVDPDGLARDEAEARERPPAATRRPAAATPTS